MHIKIQRYSYNEIEIPENQFKRIDCDQFLDMLDVLEFKWSTVAYKGVFLRLIFMLFHVQTFLLT